MSVYKRADSPFYHYDFQWHGDRFYGSTGATSRREAEQEEKRQRERVKQQAAKTKGAKGDMRLEFVVARYWLEVGQHHAGKDNTWRDLERLIGFLGAATLLTEISDDDVARLVAWRRAHRSKTGAIAGAGSPTVSPATVNRSTTEVLRKLFTRAKTAWRVKFDNEPTWRAHLLPEPQERVRELVGDEGAKLTAAMRDDYAPFFAFARLSGLRLNECLLRWSEVNWGAKRIVKKGKGSRTVTSPITSAVYAILAPLRGHHPEWVFTYVAERTARGKVKRQRYPLTYSGVKTQWRRIRTDAGVKDFRFHDFRHDVGTKLLRKTGNLKLVQRALNHADLKTTLRYAHVLDSEVAEAMENMTAPPEPAKLRRA